MAKFMIAHLQDGTFNGQQMLDAKTAQLMHTRQWAPVDSLGGMALGFYQEPGNGHRVIGHAGDTNNFHSDLHLYLDDHVGVFVSFNSAGAAGAAHGIRSMILKGFTDRYIAPPPAQEPTWKDAKADGKTLAGRYIMSRRSDSGWLRLASYLLGQATVTSDKDGVVTISAFKSLAGKPKHWREVGPFQYREVGGDSRMGVRMKDGKVDLIMADDLPPVMGLQPISPVMSATWNQPLFYASLGVLAIAALSWPLAAWIRRRYGHKFQLTGRAATLYRLTRLVAVIDMASVGLWLWFLTYAEGSIDGASSASDGSSEGSSWSASSAAWARWWRWPTLARCWRDSARGWWAKLSSVADRDGGAGLRLVPVQPGPDHPAAGLLMRLSIVATLAALALAGAAQAAPAMPQLPASAKPADIDRLVERVQKTFAVPGMSVAIVKDGEVVFAKGYGVRANGKPEPVDADTLFGIGSNTKAFTTAALSMLVDQGKLHWDDKVIDLVPGFRLYDPYVTRELTVRDILTHRSGLGLGSGDLMLFPASDFTRAEIIHNLRYFAPASSFRSKYAYDNLLYILAGDLVPTLTGVSWEDFVQTKILDRLPGPAARPHREHGSRVCSTSPCRTCWWTANSSRRRRTAAPPTTPPAPSNAAPMAWRPGPSCSWTTASSLDGSARCSDSAAQHKEMWTPQTIVTGLPDTGAATKTRSSEITAWAGSSRTTTATSGSPTPAA